MLLIDTHVLVWLDEGNPRLGPKSIKRIDEAFQNEALAVSAISFWEIAMLAQKGRLKLKMDTVHWRKDLLEKGLLEVPLNGEVGIISANLTNFHGDPTDRIIVSTTLSISGALVTADKKILEWEKLKTHDAHQ